MRLFDRFCAAALFVLAIVDCLLVPRTYTGRIWIFGTGLALMFTSMLNLLRIRNDREVRSLRLFCITANVTMLVFVIALIASIGKSRTLQHLRYPWWERCCWRRLRFLWERALDPVSGVQWRCDVRSQGPSPRQEKCCNRRDRRCAEGFSQGSAKRRQSQFSLHRFIGKAFEGNALFRYHCLRPDQSWKSDSGSRTFGRRSQTTNWEFKRVT